MTVEHLNVASGIEKLNFFNFVLINLTSNLKGYMWLIAMILEESKIIVQAYLGLSVNWQSWVYPIL